MALGYAAVYQLVKSDSGWAGSENGPLELLQAGLAATASLLVLAAAIRQPRFIVGRTLCAAMMAYAAARESDQWFESVFFDDAYKWLVGLPAAIGFVAIAWIFRKDAFANTVELLHQSSSTMFIVAGTFLATACQMLDRPGIWYGVTDIGQQMAIKSLVEESMELFAYAAIAFACFESVLVPDGQRTTRS